MKILLFLFALLIVAFFISIIANPIGKGYVIIGDAEIVVDIADDDLKRQIGLMHVEELCDECGMLFVFEESDVKNFWMKNTLIPLDMIFMDSEGVIVNIENALPCKKNPCKIYSSEFSAMYVLEVNMGIAEEFDIKIGDQAEIIQ